MTNDNVLVTGATGAFGRYLVRSLMNYPGHLTLLVRGGSDEAAFRRVSSVLDDVVDKSKVTVLRSDLSDSKLGLSDGQYATLSRNVTAVLHAAAPTRFDLPLPEARASIAETTKHITDFALSSKNLAKFGYVSTAYVAGKHVGTVLEEELSNSGFVNSYDQSKYEAEAYVRSKQDKLPTAIYRPGLIVSPDCGSHNAAVMVLTLIRKGLLPVLPGEPTDLIDITSADEAGGAISELFMNHFRPSETYHITAGALAPQLGEVLSIVKRASSIAFTGHDPQLYKEAIDRLVGQDSRLEQVYDRINYVAEYLLYPKQFSNSKTVHALGYPLGQQDAIHILEQCLAEA